MIAPSYRRSKIHDDDVLRMVCAEKTLGRENSESLEEGRAAAAAATAVRVAEEEEEQLNEIAA